MPGVRWGPSRFLNLPPSHTHTPRAVSRAWAASLSSLPQAAGIQEFLSPLKDLHQALSIVYLWALPLCPGLCLAQFFVPEFSVSPWTWHVPWKGLLQFHAHTPICYRYGDGRAAMPSSQGDLHTPRAAGPVSLCSWGQDWCGHLCPRTLLVQPPTGSSRRSLSGSPGSVWGGRACSAEGLASWMKLHRAPGLGWGAGLRSDNLLPSYKESCLSTEPST